jgi:hypothetical protein
MRMREYPANELQGLFPEQFSPDGNLNIQKFIRYCGFGVYNRTGATITRIGNASYAIPTTPVDYTAPLGI